jgi:hypothetical protein
VRPNSGPAPLQAFAWTLTIMVVNSASNHADIVLMNCRVRDRRNFGFQQKQLISINKVLILIRRLTIRNSFYPISLYQTQTFV